MMLRYNIQILKPIATSDGMGGRTETIEQVRNCMAKADPIKSDLSAVQGAIEIIEGYEFVVRQFINAPQPRASWLVKFQGETYMIKGVMRMGNMYIKLITQKRKGAPQ